MTADNRRRRDASRFRRPEPQPAVLRAAFRADLTYWIENDPRIALRVMKLMDDVLRKPFKGIGKPEPLRHAYSGLWSRRITNEHRIVYDVLPVGVLFSIARGHYTPG